MLANDGNDRFTELNVKSLPVGPRGENFYIKNFPFYGIVCLLLTAIISVSSRPRVSHFTTGSHFPVVLR